VNESAATASQRLRVIFMGTPALAVPTLEAVAAVHEVVAVVTQPDRPSGRGRRLVESPVKVWAQEQDVAVLQPERVRDADAIEAVAAIRPDVAVVVAFGQILPAAILDIPRLGCVNLHASLLPRHRGASPIQASILAGDADSGVTTMLMDEGLDTGPILQQRSLELTADETAGTLGAKLGALGAELMVETLSRLAAGTLEPTAQDSTAATMTRLISKQDGEVDWQQDATVIERQVRAMQPWPVAYTRCGDERFKLWSIEPAEERTALPPGTVIASGDQLVVACGESQAVRVLEMQRAGGRRMPIAELLRGRPIAVGRVMGASPQ